MALDPCDVCGPCSDPLVINVESARLTFKRIMCLMLTALQDIVIGTGAAQPANSTVAPVPDSAASVTLLAANPNRRGATFYNDSTEIAYIKLGAVATTASYTVQLQPGDSYILTGPIYTGIVDAIWAADAAGNMLVTEILP